MSAIDPQKKAIVQELLSRRSSLSPEKAAVVDELASRFGLNAGNDFADVQGGSSTTKQAPQVGEALKGVVLNSPQLNMLIGAGKGLGEFVQSGGQWLENMTGQPVSPPRTTATGRDVFQPSNPSQSAGKIGGQIGLGAALAAAAPASLAGQVGVGGLVGGLMAPDSPTAGATVGMAAPIVPAAAKGIVGALPSSMKAAASQKFNALAKALNSEIVQPTAADEIALEAMEMGGRGPKTPGTGSTLPKVFSDYIRRRESSSPDLSYRIARKFAIRAGNLSAVEKETSDAGMDRLLKQFSAALDDSTRQTAASKGLGQLHDEAMQEWAKAMGRQESTDKIIKALRRYGPTAAIGATGAGIYNTLTK